MNYKTGKFYFNDIQMLRDEDNSIREIIMNKN